MQAINCENTVIINCKCIRMLDCCYGSKINLNLIGTKFEFEGKNFSKNASVSLFVYHGQVTTARGLGEVWWCLTSKISDRAAITAKSEKLVGIFHILV